MAVQKTIDDLAKQVIDSQAGLMSVDDLRIFFEDGQATPNPTNQVTAEPVNAPAPQASTEPLVEPTTEPVVSEPNILEYVPDKFKDANAKTSIDKLAKSYAELEAELKKEREEKGKLDTMLQNITNQPPQSFDDSIPPSPVQPGVEDVDESLFFEKPKEATTKVASQVAAAMLLAYHQALTESQRRIQYVEGFKATHPDFNEYREDVAMILKARPDLDKRIESLPMVFEMARARYKARLDKMRKELGVPQEPTPTPTPAPAPNKPTEADIVDKVKAAVISELQKRKAAAGITGGVAPMKPGERSQQVVTQKPKTPEELIFDEIMASGPKKLDLTL